jgi:hypothetical protein
MPRIPVLVALAILAVTAAGCGSKPATPGVAQVATTTTATTTTTSSQGGTLQSKEEGAIKYSSCMRANGVPRFPDPVRSGEGMSLSLDPRNGVDPDSPKFQAAEKKCEKLLPGGKGGERNSAKVAAAQAQMLRFSACMRSHGVPDFPDPPFSGGGAKLRLNKRGGLNPRSPVFQAAEKACEDEMPGNGRPSGGGTVQRSTGADRGTP